MRNNANKRQKKNAKVKCEIPRIKTKKRKKQMRNNAKVKGKKMQKSNAK